MNCSKELHHNGQLLDQDAQAERYQHIVLRQLVRVLATATKHEWSKDSPVKTFEVNARVMQNDRSTGKEGLVNVFSVECDRDTAMANFGPGGVIFDPTKIDIQRWRPEHIPSQPPSPLSSGGSR